MTTRSELALVRAQNLDRIRAANGMGERFTLHCACALHDRTFTADFARLTPTRRFECDRVEKVERSPDTPDMVEDRHGSSPWNVAADDIDFASLSCPWCAASQTWTRCGRCKLLVCSAKTEGKIFQCRKSCGARTRTTPMVKMEATRADSGAVTRAIGRVSQLFLPRGRP